MGAALSELRFPVLHGLHAEKKDCMSPLPSGVDTETRGGGINGPHSLVRESGAAVKLQRVYRGYRTRRRLADSAVVAEELWWQAIDYARLNHSTVSFFDFSKPETAASRWHRIRLNASKVGKGLSKDDKAQKLAFQHWIEAIDPRHRYGHNLHRYYEEWCKSDAGQPFFYWLDVGDGKDLDLKDCPRSKLRKQCIKYLGPQERENYEYLVIEGKIVHKISGELLDTNKGTQGAKWIFVVSPLHKLYAGEKKKGEFHHSSFLAGGATTAAGRLVVEQGVLKSVSAYSGHYRPTEDNLARFLAFLKENGVDLDAVQIRTANEDSEKDEDTISRIGEKIAVQGSSNPRDLKIEIPTEAERTIFGKLSPEESQGDRSYNRTLSDGLWSPGPQVPKNAILERINSKNATRSYQLGHQLSRKWSTGAGPRIGCVADYPVELRDQALDLLKLSPRDSPATSTSYLPASALASPRACRVGYICSGNGNGNVEA